MNTNRGGETRHWHSAKNMLRESWMTRCLWGVQAQAKRSRAVEGRAGGVGWGKATVSPLRSWSFHLAAHWRLHKPLIVCEITPLLRTQSPAAAQRGRVNENKAIQLENSHSDAYRTLWYSSEAKCGKSVTIWSLLKTSSVPQSQSWEGR